MTLIALARCLAQTLAAWCGQSCRVISSLLNRPCSTNMGKRLSSCPWLRRAYLIILLFTVPPKWSASAPLMVAERMRDVISAWVESARDNFIYYAASPIIFRLFTRSRPKAAVMRAAILSITSFCISWVIQDNDDKKSGYQEFATSNTRIFDNTQRPLQALRLRLIFIFWDYKGFTATYSTFTLGPKGRRCC